MLLIQRTNRFNKEFAKMIRRGKDATKVFAVLPLLETGEPLPRQYNEHKLTGNYAGLWECHIESDWLLVYDRRETECVLILTRTGTHADLFK